MTTEIERPELEEKLSELEILKQSLDEAKGKEEKLTDQFLRLGAEFENYRKRSETRISDARKFGREEVLLQLLFLYDILVQAVEASEKTTDLSSLKTGLKLVHQQIEKLLKDQGLAPIQAVGKLLDPHKHEAISQEENHDVEEGTIVGEIQKGFSLGERVVRTSKVRVAVKPKNATDEDAAPSPETKED